MAKLADYFPSYRTIPIALPVSEAAEFIGKSRPGMYPLIEDGTVEAVKVGGRTLIKTQSLVDLIDKAEPYPTGKLKKERRYKGKKYAAGEGR